MGIGGSPSTGLGAGCWVVPWSPSRRTMKRLNAAHQTALFGGQCLNTSFRIRIPRIPHWS